MMPWRWTGRTGALLASLCCFQAFASTEDRASYRVALAGISIADLEIAVRRDGDQYDAQLEGSYRVLFWSGKVSSRSTGAVDASGPSPKRFETSNNNSDEPSRTVIEFARPEGPVQWGRTPPAPEEWTKGRTPLEKIHLRTALDPVSAIAASVLGSTGGTAPDVCSRAVRVFTGTTVFELDFQGALPSEGDRVACAVTYRPLSGHRVERSNADRLSKPGSIKISFERLPSGAWVPAMVTVPTRIGPLVVERT